MPSVVPKPPPEQGGASFSINAPAPCALLKAKLQLESGNKTKQNMAARGAFWKWHHWMKIDRLLPMATINMHMKFQNKIPKQIWFRSGNHVAYRRKERWTGWFRYTLSNFVGWGCENQIWLSINVKRFVAFSTNKIYELPSTDNE